jgi:hypothetical protein
MLTLATTASEQMYFDGAPLAHVVLYYDKLRQEQLNRSLASVRARRVANSGRLLLGA